MSKNDNSKAAYLNELIKHHPQSAYNGKKIMENEVGGIMLYAFKKGIELSKGKSENICFIYIIDGIVDYIINDEIFSLEKGQTITIPPNATQEINVKKNVKIMTIWFKKDKRRRRKKDKRQKEK